MPVNNPSQVGTFTISNTSITIDETDNFRIVAMKLVSGTVRFQGTMDLNGTNSDPITLVANDPVTISGDAVITGLTIDATSGSVHLICRS